jgi:hypothetical protein
MGRTSRSTTISPSPAELHHAVTSMLEADWHYREKVNEAAANNLKKPPER